MPYGLVFPYNNSTTQCMMSLIDWMIAESRKDKYVAELRGGQFHIFSHFRARDSGDDLPLIL